MIVQWLGILACIIMIFTLAVIISPCYFIFTCDKSTDIINFLQVHYIHPSFIKILIYFPEKKCDILLFGKMSFSPFKSADDADSGDIKYEYEDSEEEIKEDEWHSSEKDIQETDKTTEIFSDKSMNIEAEEYEGDESLSASVMENESEEKFESIEEEQVQKDKIKKEKRWERRRKTAGKYFQKVKTLVGFVKDRKKIAKKAVSWLKRVVYYLVRVIKFNRLSVSVIAGFENPANTGILYGIFTGIHHGLELQSSRRLRLDFKPVFDNRDIFQCNGSISARTSIFRLLIPAVIGIFTFPYISAFFLWRDSKKLIKEIKS